LAIASYLPVNREAHTGRIFTPGFVQPREMRIRIAFWGRNGRSDQRRPEVRAGRQIILMDRDEFLNQSARILVDLVIDSE
jgi:hypothetical protein